MSSNASYELEKVAQHFLLMGIQHWGQTDAERLKARDAYLEAAGKPGDIAWLDSVLDAMPWGKFESEVKHLASRLLEARG